MIFQISLWLMKITMIFNDLLNTPLSQGRNWNNIVNLKLDLNQVVLNKKKNKNKNKKNYNYQTTS